MEPLAWFETLSAPERLEVVRQFLAELSRVDPGLRQSVALWKQGTTARVAADVACPQGVMQLGINLLVEGADPKLMRALRSRVESGALIFGRGRAQLKGTGTSPVQLAELGYGSLMVREHLGELVLVASTQHPVSVPAGLAVGRPLPTKLPDGEGFVATLFEGQLLLLGSYQGLRQQEVQAARTAPILLGLVPVTQGLLLIGLGIPGLLDGHADLPFALGIEPPETRRWPPPAPDGGAVILVALVERRDGVVRALRTLKMSAAWSAELHRLVEGQMDCMDGYCRAQYEVEVADSRRRWPRPQDIARDFVVVEVGLDLDRRGA